MVRLTMIVDPPPKIDIFGQISAILANLVPNRQTSCSRINKGGRANYIPKYAVLGIYRPCRLIWCPVGWLVGGCGARAVSRISQDTYLLYAFVIAYIHKKVFVFDLKNLKD